MRLPNGRRFFAGAVGATLERVRFSRGEAGRFRIDSMFSTSQSQASITDDMVMYEECPCPYTCCDGRRSVKPNEDGCFLRCEGQRKGNRLIRPRSADFPYPPTLTSLASVYLLIHVYLSRGA